MLSVDSWPKKVEVVPTILTKCLRTQLKEGRQKILILLIGWMMREYNFVYILTFVVKYWGSRSDFKLLNLLIPQILIYKMGLEDTLP